MNNCVAGIRETVQLDVVNANVHLTNIFEKRLFFSHLLLFYKPYQISFTPNHTKVFICIPLSFF